jgi:nucleoside-diphosphate-sugar epimerase
MTKLIFGCGYLGLRVARLWRGLGETVVAATRSRKRARALAAEGLSAVVADVNEPATLSRLPDADSVLFAVGYDRSAPADKRRSIGEVYAGGLANVLNALPSSVERIVYISSTGVYGNSAGECLDEDSPCEPQREGGRACLAAERVLQKHRLANRGIILRLAGIYGPDRIPRLAEIDNGAPLEASADGLLNLIHVDDAARVVVAAAAKANPPVTFCVSDGQPVLRREWLSEVARLAGLPEPRFVEPHKENPASRASSSKRISNRRMMSDLELELKYPSYRQGLAAIFGKS